MIRRIRKLEELVNADISILYTISKDFTSCRKSKNNINTYMNVAEYELDIEYEKAKGHSIVDIFSIWTQSVA